MSTIITLIGSLVLGLIVLVVLLWRRTHRELRHIRRELRATQQELRIQRILIEDQDGNDDQPTKRRHLRALALIAPILLWIRNHPAPAVASVGTAAAVAILVVGSSPSEQRPFPDAAPSPPVTAPPSQDLPPPPASVKTSPPSTASQAPAPDAGDAHQDVEISHAVREPFPPTEASSTTTSSTTITTRSPSPNGPDQPAGGGLCVLVDLQPLLGIDLCPGRVTSGHA